MIKTTYEKQYRYSCVNSFTGSLVDFFEDPFDKQIYTNDQMRSMTIKVIIPDRDRVKTYSFFVAKKHINTVRSIYNIARCSLCSDNVNCRKTSHGDICESCYRDHRFECQHCHQEDFGNFSKSKKFCTSCAKELNLICCDFCGNALEEKDANIYKSGIFCNEHRSGNEYVKPDPSIHYMSIKPGKIVKHHRLVGTEIELESGNLKNNLWMPDGCGVVNDGSLNSSGREFITAPAASAKLEKIITETCTNLKKQGFVASSRCGLHVHIDMRDFRLDPYFAYKIVKTYMAAEEALLQMLPDSRRGNHYCDSIVKRVNASRLKPTMSLDEFITNYYKYDDPEYIKEDKWHSKYEDSRYCGLNMHSLYYRGTLEIRYHDGTNNADQILNWIQLHLSLVEWAMYAFNETQLEKIKAAEPKAKLALLLKMIKATKTNSEYALKRQEKYHPTTATGRVRHRLEQVAEHIEIPF